MTDSQKWLTLVSVVLFFWIVYLLLPIFTPFLIAGGLAYLCNPLVELLQKWKLSRVIASVLVFFTIVLILVGGLALLIPLVATEISALAGKVPAYLQTFNSEVLKPLGAKLGIKNLQLKKEVVDSMMGDISKWKPAGVTLLKLVKLIGQSGAVLAGFLMNLVLIPIITLYLLIDWKKLLERIHGLVPRAYEETVGTLASNSNTVLSGFLRGQFLVMLALGVIYSVGLKIVGLEYAILIGSIAGLLSFVPYLGFIVGIGIAFIAMYLNMPTWSVMPMVYILIVFGVGQIIESIVLTPWLVGDRIGLHPVAVIFAVMAGGHLFGFTGILLALPMAAVVVVLLRYAHEQYVKSDVYQEKDKLIQS